MSNAAAAATRSRVFFERTLALALLLLPALTWCDVPGTGYTRGYLLPPVLRDFDALMRRLDGNPPSAFNPFLLLYLLPVLCLATLLNEARRADSTFVAALAGVVPVASVAYAFGLIGTDLFPLLKPAAYVAVGCALLLVALSSGLGPRSPAQPRTVRNRASVLVLLLAVGTCVLLGRFNRPA